MLQKLVISLALAVILGVPLALRLTSPAPKVPDGAKTLVIVTPHVPQIRLEFGEAFERWHRRVYGEAVFVDWRNPGATSEILKILEAQYSAAAKAGKFDLTDPKNPHAPPGTIAFDLMFGGGSFDHGRLKTGVSVDLGGAAGGSTKVVIPMSMPAGFSEEQLAQWFGRENGAVRNTIGAGTLFDPQQYWIGTALSSFGILYNREVLDRMGLAHPKTFADMTDPRLVGMVILADPRQSGSITTALDAILNASLWNRAEREGWKNELDAAFAEERTKKVPWERALHPSRAPSVQLAFEDGWRALREITANTRTFVAAATRPPIDISAGEGAMGLSIDFYGRGQAQALSTEGDHANRLGYVDPVGATYVDADPASLLRAGPHPELAKRFIEFCMTDEAQALWQLPSARDPRSVDNPKLPAASQSHAAPTSAERLGPRLYELRRMPVRPSMYDPQGPYWAHFVDQVDPFAIAAAHRPAGWRSGIGLMVGAFSVDNKELQSRAWQALAAARADKGFPSEVLREMELLFYAFPPTPDKDGGKEGGVLAFDAASYRAVRERWRDAGTLARVEIDYTDFFRRSYQRVIVLGQARVVR
jgi:iron(III) transport system substrate-binding protein